ncbi:MAG: hypothetical protein GXX96_06955 [Planctomycetaceae bacterium]|nr:hypothetical protein [Planctomycetaceae bacterium]
MVFHLHNANLADPISEWLAANKQHVLDGTAEYQGTPINEKTIFRRYVYVVSLGVVCITFKTDHMLPTKQGGNLLLASLTCSLVSLLFGWWSFPWGPFCTIHALFVNLTGGTKQTAIGVLQRIEWGWDAPAEVGVAEYHRDLVDMTLRAKSEIEIRQLRGGFPDGVGVRITPTKWADNEVEIAFDYPVSDGRFWIDESHGVILIIDKEHEVELADHTIDYADDRFVAILGRILNADVVE